VDIHLQQHAAAALGVGAPALAKEVNLVAPPLQVNRHRLANHAFLQPLLGLPEQREQAQHMPCHQLHARLLRGGKQGIAVFYGERERLLAEQVLAALQHLHAEFIVRVGRRRQNVRLDFGRVQERVEALIGSGL
jgi:hypothetical protein